MKTESVTIQFDAEKLSAINIYIMEKGLSRNGRRKDTEGDR